MTTYLYNDHEYDYKELYYQNEQPVACDSPIRQLNLKPLINTIYTVLIEEIINNIAIVECYYHPKTDTIMLRTRPSRSATSLFNRHKAIYLTPTHIGIALEALSPETITYDTYTIEKLKELI